MGLGSSHKSCCFFYKRLRDEHFYTFLGMVGYCMKDNTEEHFEFVHHDVSTENMNEGEMEYAKLRKLV